MPRSTSRKYPLAPLMDALGIRALESSRGVVGHEGFGPHDPSAGIPAMATLCGVTERTMHRWATEGIPEPQTDRLACHVANRHPIEIWPDWSWLDDEVVALDQLDDRWRHRSAA